MVVEDEDLVVRHFRRLVLLRVVDVVVARVGGIAAKQRGGLVDEFGLLQIPDPYELLTFVGDDLLGVHLVGYQLVLRKLVVRIKDAPHGAERLRVKHQVLQADVVDEVRVDVDLLDFHDLLYQVLDLDVLVDLEANVDGLVVGQLGVVLLEQAAVRLLTLLLLHMGVVDALVEGVVGGSQARIHDDVLDLAR